MSERTDSPARLPPTGPAPAGFGRSAWLVFKTLQARLRFVAVLVGVGLVIGNWDTLRSWYEKLTRPPAPALAADPDTEFVCPMHPAIVRDSAKEKCPICFMPLSKRKKGSGQSEPLPAGVVSRVQLSPYRVVLAGVETWPVDGAVLRLVRRSGRADPGDVQLDYRTARESYGYVWSEESRDLETKQPA